MCVGVDAWIQYNWTWYFYQPIDVKWYTIPFSLSLIFTWRCVKTFDICIPSLHSFAIYCLAEKRLPWRINEIQKQSSNGFVEKVKESKREENRRLPLVKYCTTVSRIYIKGGSRYIDFISFCFAWFFLWKMHCRICMTYIYILFILQSMQTE